MNAFLRKALADKMEGGLRPLAVYQAQWPGLESLIASEYAGLAAESGGQDVPPGDATARRIGGYRILSELGEGGQGRVYLAEDERLRRQVALKLLVGLGPVTESALLRFRREAEIASRLMHPGLCAVYGAGVEGGVPYIAMQYVPGETLAARLSRGRDQGPITPLRVLSATELVAKVARALHAAHEAGIVHRDVKPGNVMITPDGEPVLLDFGVARADDAGRATLTATGDVLGTPAYMSPEQIEGRTPTDRRADVWSLGAVLFECLTLRRPFEEPTREALYRSIVTSEARPVRRLNPAIPRDLEIVVATALAKPLGARYQTALDLAEDLDRVRDHVPIRARPSGMATRLARWTRRNPAVAAIGAALLVSLVCGLGVALHLLGVAREQRDEKGAALVKARVAALSAMAASSASSDPALRLILAREAARLDSTLGRRALREALSASFERARLAGHYGPVVAARWSPDGTRAVTASRDGTARIWDAEGRLLSELRGHEGGLLAAAWSPDGARLLTASDDFTARLWSRDGAAIATLEGHGASVSTVAFAPDGALLLTVSGNAARLWSADARLVRVLGAGGDGPLLGAWFHPRGSEVTVAARSGVVRRFGADGAQLATTELGVSVDAAAPSPRGDELALGSRDGALVLVHLDAGGSRKLEGHAGLSVISWAPDGSALVTGGADGAAKVWGPDGAIRHVAIASGPAITAAAWCGSDAFVVGTTDGWVRHSSATGGESVALGRHGGAVLGCEMAADGRGLLTWSGDATARISTLAPMEPWFVPIRGGGRGALGSGNRLQVLSESLRVTLDTDGPAHRVLDREEAPPGSRFVPVPGGPAGAHLLVTGARCSMRDFDGRTLATFETGLDVREASGSADGTTVVVRGQKAPNEIVDVATGTRRPFPGTLAPVVFAPDGSIVAGTEEGPSTLDREGAVVARHPIDAEAEDGIAEVSLAPGGRFKVFRTAWHWLVVFPERGASMRRELGTIPDARLAWSPSAERLLCGGSLSGMQILELPSGALRPIGPPVKAVLADFLSEDRVAIAEAGAVNFWDVGGDRVADVVPLPARPTSLVVDRSRSRLYVVTQEGVLGLGFDDGDLLRLADSMRLRDLTLDERIVNRDLLGPDNELAIRALRWIRERLPRSPGRSEILARASSDPAVDAPLRAAIASTLPTMPEDLRELNEFSWAVLKRPGADPAALALALRGAETLVRCVPASGAWLNTLGIARYRMGDYAGAEEILRRSELMNRRQLDPIGIGEDLAVLAMAEHRQGRSCDATLDRLRAIVAARALSEDERAFVGELEALLGRPVGSR